MTAEPHAAPADVSVVLPVYNGSRYLAESLASVLGQEGVDYEVLVCDDASSDDSLEIVRSFSSPRLSVCRNAANRGLFPTLNRLIERSRAPLVRLWAQDDAMLPGCLAAEVAFHRAHAGVAMAYCARQLIGAEGEEFQPVEADETPEVVPPALAAQIAFYHGSMPGNIATVSLKRRVLEDVGLFREDMRVSADFEMWVRLSKRYPIGFINTPLIKLRAHGRQFSREQGIGVTFIREDREIVQELLGRLPDSLQAYARRYNRHHRLRMYFHYMIKCLVEGEFGAAGEVWREIRMFDSPLMVGLYWLLSGNGRVCAPVPRYVS